MGGSGDTESIDLRLAGLRSAGLRVTGTPEPGTTIVGTVGLGTPSITTGQGGPTVLGVPSGGETVLLGSPSSRSNPPVQRATAHPGGAAVRESSAGQVDPNASASAKSSTLPIRVTGAAFGSLAATGSPILLLASLALILLLFGGMASAVRRRPVVG